MKKTNFLIKTTLLSMALSTIILAAEKPTNLSVSDITKDSATISWEHDDNESNGFGVYYTKLPFGATDLTDANFTNALIISDITTHETTFDNLESNSTYGAKVSSCVGEIDKVTCLHSDEDVIFTTLAQEKEEEKIELPEAKSDVWCVSHWSNLIEIDEIPNGVDGVNIYRKLRDSNESGELILTETDEGEYVDPDDNLQPSYEAYEYIVKSFTDDNGTITESEGVTIKSD